MVLINDAPSKGRSCDAGTEDALLNTVAAAVDDAAATSGGALMLLTIGATC